VRSTDTEKALLRVGSKPRLAVVTNILAPYRVPFFEALASRSSDFLVVLLAEKHASRDWAADETRFKSIQLNGLQVKMPASVDPLHVNWGAWRALRQFDPDIVLGGGYSPAHFESLAYCIAHSKLYVPWGELVMTHQTQSRWLWRAARHIMIGRSRAFVASSSATQRAYEFYGAPRERILVSLMPVGTRVMAQHAADCRESGETQALRAGRTKPVFLTASRLVDEKGIPQLLRAFALVQAEMPSATLLVAGDGPQRSQYERMARDLGLKGIEFLGHRPARSLAAYYSAADAFVFPTLHDTFGAVIPEAMAAGTIVVSSIHAAAAHDFVVEGQTGFLADPHDATQLAARMLAAARLSSQQRLSMLTEADKLVAHDDFETSAEAIVRFLSNAVHGNTLAPPLQRHERA
jgi:glycosyltransferase involved in cell wall biosynthesis